MKLTQKLLGFMNRVFDKDPAAVLALRLNYDGAMQWKIEDGRLTTQVVGGSGGPLSINLSDYTIATLVALLGSQPGYSVPYQDTSSLSGKGALTLIDGTGNQSQSNGDHLNSYTSVLWSWLESVSSELGIASAQIVQMLRQMVIGTAEGEWLDEFGSYYDIPRIFGETDAVYGARIIASVGRPRGNNVALEMAINTVTGGLQADVSDYTTPTPFTTPYNGTSYGLFDVIYSVALDGDEDLSVYTGRVSSIVESFRDAGTHMRTILINGVLSDTYPFSSITEVESPLDIEFLDLTESAALGLKRHDGTYRRDGARWDGSEWIPADGGTVSDPAFPSGGSISLLGAGALYLVGGGFIGFGSALGSPVLFNNSGEELILTITDDGVTAPPELI